MKFRLFLICFVLICSSAFASDYVCYDGTRFTAHYQSSGTHPGGNCFVVPETLIGDYRDLVARNDNRFLKVEGEALLPMTQAEIDAIKAQDVLDSQNAELARLSALDNDLASAKTISLPKIEAEIDKISSLSDAKVFLKRLCRYLASRS